MSSVDYPVGQVKTTWTSKSFMSPGVDPWLQCFMPVGSMGTQTHMHTTLLHDCRIRVIYPT